MPKISRHSSGQARICIAGRMHYLGQHGSPEAMVKAADLWREYLANGSRPLARAPNPTQAVATVGSLFAAYREWMDATGKYQKRGEPTTGRSNVERALRSFEALHEKARLAQLNAAAIIRWRDRLEGNPRLCRVGINRLVAQVLRVLAWGRERGYLDRATWAEVSTIKPLRRGSCGNRPEGLPPKPALPFSIVEKVAVALEPSDSADMLRVMMQTGMRPGEVCSMRWADIDKKPEGGNGAWLYTVADAKASHYGKRTVYWLGKGVQDILNKRPGLPGAHLFLTQQRRQPWCSGSLHDQVEKACRSVGVPVFTPHAVRHSFLTWCAREFGVVAASRAANHSSVQVTARYVHSNDDDALRVVAGVQKAIGG